MAFENVISRVPGLTAAADLSAKQFFFVKVTGDREVNLAGDGEAAMPLDNDPLSGEEASIPAPGSTVKVVASAAIAAGADVATAAGGKAKTSTSGDYINGQALTAAGADLEVFTMLYNPVGRTA